jgi:ceramide glucosyltransferase
MIASVIAAASFCGITASLHIVSIVVAIVRCRPRGCAPLRETPPVTIVRPVCGLDNFVEETLRTCWRDEGALVPRWLKQLNKIARWVDHQNL